MAYQAPHGLSATSAHGLGDLVASRAPLLAMFAAHDHGNDWCCPLPGSDVPKWLCHAHHSGFGGYGQVNGSPKWRKGARVIRIAQAPCRVTTWVTTWARLGGRSVSRSDEVELGACTLVAGPASRGLLECSASMSALLLLSLAVTALLRALRCGARCSAPPSHAPLM